MAPKDIINTLLFCVILQKWSFKLANVAFAQERNDLVKDPVNYYTTVELVCSEGYPVQEHKVVTKDGYILTIHRIPNGKTRPEVPHSKNHYHKIHLNHHPDFDNCVKESLNATSTGLPVLFAHGILMASDGWLLQGPGYDLAYIMADRGYDIWLLNVRGNFYSRKHKTLKPSDSKFWDFSFHEHGVFDLPATIDYILNVTKKDKIGYVGLSMGTTMFFSMASLLPEYNDKILGFAALAPVAFLQDKNMNFRRKTVYNLLIRLLDELLKRGNIHEVFPRSTGFANFGKNYCSKGSQLQDLCYDIISAFLGYHSKAVLRNKFQLYTTHIPTGTSIKTFTHYLQNEKGNCFRLFDYGSEKNIQLYGSPTPPDYPLSKITAPTALYYSMHDFFYDAKDIDDLRKLLPNVVDVDVKYKFNHVDYLWSFKARDKLYPKPLSFFKKLSDQYYRRNTTNTVAEEKV